VCVGLDPRLEWLPSLITDKMVKEYGKTFKAVGQAILEFNRQVIDVVEPYVGVVKPQIAFYEQYGPDGLNAFWESIKYAHEKGLQVVVDAKRGDIDSTAMAYANSLIGKTELFGVVTDCYGADCVTVNPFLGEDSIVPFIETAIKNETGVFILVKTSNPGSRDIQDLKIKTLSVSEIVASWVNKYAKDNLDSMGYSSVGAVVGATYPEVARELRKLMPHSIFLVPGFGVQGGELNLISNFFNRDGFGAIINSSREVVFSDRRSDNRNYLSLIEMKVKELSLNINRALKL